MSFDIVVRNASLPDGTLADIAGADGKIALIATTGTCADYEATTIVEAHGRVALPGVIDPHVHLNWPFERRPEDVMTTETRAAAAGGVTTIGHYPLGVTGDLVENLTEVKSLIAKHSLVDVTPSYPILTFKQLNQMDELYDEGVTTFKILRAYRPNDVYSFGGVTDTLMFRVMCQVADMRRRGKSPLLKVHCENNDLSDAFKTEYQAKYPDLGRDEPLTDVTWAHCRPDIVEAESVSSALYLARQTRCPIMIVHLSSAMSLDLIRRARADGVECYVETTPLYLETDAYHTGCANGPLWTRVQPSVKFAEDRSALWEAVADGTIDVLGTDHCATRKSAYAGKSVWDEGASGRSILALALPIMLNAVNAGRLRLDQLVSLMCSSPAGVMGLARSKGEIRLGADADIVLCDLGDRRVVTADSLNSYADHSVFEGRELQGWPQVTIVRGNVVWQDGVAAETNVGTYAAGHGLQTATAQRATR